jgi:dolichol-phosphate mannosyltransferase
MTGNTARPELEILLPVHNEGESIEATIRDIHEELSPTASVGFIICEDGSKDDSKGVLTRLAHELPMRLNLSDARKGYSLAMREGMAIVKADYLLCLDSDGQCDPKDFVNFWKSRVSADVVIGWRVRRADTPLRKGFSRIFHFFYQFVFRVPVHDPSCPFVLCRREVALSMSAERFEMKEGFWWEFIARAHRRNLTILEIPVNHRLRTAGITQVYKWRRMPGIFFRHLAAIFKIWADTRKSA